MNHRRSTLAVRAFLFALLFAPCALADFYVSPNGSDAGDGSIEKPFASLEKARDAVRALNPSSRTSTTPLTIWLRAGDYVRTNALALSAADSGSQNAPVLWRAYRDERPRLIGARVLRGFQPVKDDALLSRLDPAARNHILQLDLRAQGLTNFRAMHSRGFGRPTTPAHCELFFAHRPMTLARWPNEGGWEKIAAFPAGSGKGDDHGGSVGNLPDGFNYSGDRPRRWKDTSDLWVHGFWSWDWANSYERVGSLDLEKRLVVTAPPHGLYGFRAGQRFHWLNILEELDQPGEWFVDRHNATLYFWPPAPIDSAETLFSILDQPLVKITDARHVTIQGLALEATQGSAVEITGGANNRVIDCFLRNLGNLGVVINGGTNHGVARCEILDTGDGGVSLSGGDRQTLVPGGHFVEDTHFQRQARWTKTYAPCVLLNGVGLRVSHNHMHDHPHCAILFTGNDHLIEFNDIHHIALETGDVGAIYTGRDYTFRGNRIRHNFIHETGGVGMGSMGVYMDDCVSGSEIFGNVLYKVHWAVFIGGGRDHRIENNLFVECDPAIRVDGRGLDTAPVWRGMVNDYMRKQLAAIPAALYREKYPAIKTLDTFYTNAESAFKGIPAADNIVARNICVGKWFEAAWHASQTPAQFDLRDNYVTTNLSEVLPSFPASFKIDPASPAFKNGFQPIPFDQIGVRPLSAKNPK